MSALYIVLPLALIVVLVALFAYLWAARHGQFDDLTTPAMRVLHDDEGRRKEPERPEGAKEAESPVPDTRERPPGGR